MTAPAGSDGGGERDDLDDSALHSMRAVWVSMRDEDPPAAGLAELLAAARTKAEAMQPREPWWRRALGTLRRPPVLALASVVVLIGGAVWIAGRRDELQAVRAGDPAPGDVVTSSESRRTPAIAPANDAEFYGAPSGATEKGKEDQKLDGATRPTAPARPPASAPRPRLQRPIAPPPPPPEPAMTAPATGEAAQGGVQQQDDRADDRGGAPAAPPPSAPIAPQASPSNEERGGASAPAQQIDQLAKQLETAAARGDCATVRSLDARIRALDANFHKNQIAGRADVKRCAP